MSTGPAENRAAPNRIDLLQGTLDMLILRTLLFAPAHGHTIAHAIEHGSEEVLQVRHGLLSAKEGLSDNNRKAKYYSLTAKGRKRLIAESSKWDRLSQAIGRIMQPAEEEGQS